MRKILCCMILSMAGLAVSCAGGRADAKGGTKTPEPVGGPAPNATEGDSIAPGAYEGSWEGTLEAGTAKLTMRFTIDGDGALLDVPAQNLKGARASSVRYGDGGVTMDFSAFKSVFKGKTEGSGIIRGTWNQGGGSYELVLERMETASIQVGNDYGGVDIRFPSDAAGITLAGTLSLPEGKGPFPALILLTGSGPHNRDEEILGHKIFRIVAEAMGKRGWAVLRCDDRGWGESGGVFQGATSADFALDAAGAYRTLSGDARIDKSRIAFGGHSEGGYVALLAERILGGVRALVLLAAPGVAGREIIMDQNRDLLAASGASAKEIEAKAAINGEVLDVSMAHGPFDAERARKLLSDAGLSKDQVAAQIAALSDPWYRSFLASDPAKAVSLVRSPILAFGGTKDIQVRAGKNLAAIKAAAATGIEVSTRSWEGYNHLFQKAVTGLPDEYAALGSPFPDEVVMAIADWLEGLK